MASNPYGVFQHRPFLTFLMFQSASATASEVIMVGVGWHLYLLTDSAFALGLIGFFQALPVIGLALWSGHAADRFDRRAILTLTQSAHALGTLLLLGLAFLPRPPLAAFYGTLLLLGVARSFQGPTNNALFPSLLPAELLPTAITWRTTNFHFFLLVGPVLGGLAISLTGHVGGAYALAFLLATIAAGLARRLPASPVKRGEHVPLPSDHDWWAGVKFVRSHKILLGAVTLDLFAVLFGGATALLPVFAKDILHVGPMGLGLLRAAPGLGSLLIGLRLLHHPPENNLGRLFLWCVAGYGVSMIGFGWSIHFWWSFFFLVMSGVTDGVSVVIRHVLALTTTPDHLRGRVSAVMGVFIQSSNKLGEFESGVAAALLGTAPSVVIGGGLTLACVAATAKLVPALRRLDRLPTAHPLP